MNNNDNQILRSNEIRLKDDTLEKQAEFIRENSIAVVKAITAEFRDLGMKPGQAEVRLLAILARTIDETLNTETSRAYTKAELLQSEKLYVIRTNVAADLDHWHKYTSWTPGEAAFVLSDLDPDKVFINDGVAHALQKKYPTYESIDKFLKILFRGAQDGVIPARANAASWLAIANEFGLPVADRVAKRFSNQTEPISEGIDDDHANPRAVNDWTVNPENKPINEFYADIKKALREMEARGTRKPTGAWFRKHLAANQALFPLIKEIRIRKKEVVYYLSARSTIETGILSSKALDSLLRRYILKK
jgi:hypothetical protein